jgi:hypothetical protein
MLVHKCDYHSERVNEHIQDIHNNKNGTAFSQYLLNTGHKFEESDEVMQIIKTA